MPSEVLVEKKKLAKPPLELHHLGDRVLRQPAKRVAKVDDEIRQIVRQMLQTMYSEDGIGLAAPQVAINKQIVVIDIDPENPEHQPLVLINPTVKSFGSEIVASQEGCLSIPGVYLDVQRPEAIEVSFKDEQGRPRTIKATGLLSRAIQHEIDHLNGVLFVDRVNNQLALTQELKKRGFSTQAVKPVA
ncbi:MAG: peptide deformylase [Myxacorys californica WJT36-NPBG1]|nr:peptide deformylase [Myxacorys californica WJT36-NPBG1]